jgi:hypothetical protein
MCFIIFRLQAVLEKDDICDILDSDLVCGKHVMHNCLYINKSGIVTNIDPKGKYSKVFVV